jgi:hypothetical protein
MAPSWPERRPRDGGRRRGADRGPGLAAVLLLLWLAAAGPGYGQATGRPPLPAVDRVREVRADHTLSLLRNAGGQVSFESPAGGVALRSSLSARVQYGPNMK